MQFYKYHGTGNDFILMDNRQNKFNIKDAEHIKLLCDRHFGIGADGMLLLENEDGFDFKMVFANPDGSMGAMCGNGGRCIVHFAHHILKIVKDPQNVRFLAADGEHEAKINADMVELKMQDVKEIGKRNGQTFLRSGTTPHNVIFVENLDKFPVVLEGRKIRNSDPDGVNVNFVEQRGGIFHVRTYERGVEDETLACGTGVTSVSIAAHHLGKLKENICHIKTRGGDLTVKFENSRNGYENIWLIGPAKLVFIGEMI